VATSFPSRFFPNPQLTIAKSHATIRFQARFSSTITISVGSPITFAKPKLAQKEYAESTEQKNPL
jgi:hypothetical protein